jgi:hypothetical protein
LLMKILKIHVWGFLMLISQRGWVDSSGELSGQNLNICSNSESNLLHGAESFLRS